MVRPALALLLAASLAFLASSIAYALIAGHQDLAPVLLSGTAPDIDARGWPDLPEIRSFADTQDPTPPAALARPSGTALQLLLVAVWGAILHHAARSVLRARAAARAKQRGERASTQDRPDEMLAMAAALAAAAAWPWLAERSALWGLLAVAAAAAFAIFAALGDRGPAGEVPRRTSVGIFAGWTVVALYAAFAAILVGDLGMSPAFAAVISVLLLLVTAVEVQMRLGPLVGFSLMIMWAMIGIASQTVGADLTVALAAVAAIAALAAVMVRVLS